MIPDVFPFKEKTSGIGQVEPQNNNKMMENFEACVGSPGGGRSAGKVRGLGTA